MNIISKTLHKTLHSWVLFPTLGFKVLVPFAVCTSPSITLQKASFIFCITTFIFFLFPTLRFLLLHITFHCHHFHLWWLLICCIVKVYVTSPSLSFLLQLRKHFSTFNLCQLFSLFLIVEVSITKLVVEVFATKLVVEVFVIEFSFAIELAVECWH